MDSELGLTYISVIFFFRWALHFWAAWLEPCAIQSSMSTGSIGGTEIPSPIHTKSRVIPNSKGLSLIRGGSDTPKLASACRDGMLRLGESVYPQEP